MRKPFLLTLNGLVASGFLFFLFFLSPACMRDSCAADGNSCIACHSDMWQDMQASVHTKHGISCDKCHGGDPTKDDMAAAKAAGTGYVGVPDKKQIAQICSSCHSDVEAMNFYGLPTDQLARYKTSVHGKKLLIEGDTHVAVCSDCHDNHNILPISDPQSTVYPANIPKTCSQCHAKEKLMASYKIPPDVYRIYQGSVHGKALLEKKDLSAPHCASCHGSHGAVPPGVKEIATTCGKCHVNEKKYFLESVHAEAQKQGKFSECVSCHGNHGVQPPTPALYEEACVKCHDSGSPAFRQGLQIAEAVRKTDEQFKAAEAIVKQASIEGLFVEDETAALENVKTDVISIAPMQHTLSLKRISEIRDKVVSETQTIKQSIQQKRENLRRRKWALVPIWIFIFIMVLAFWAKYKELEQKRKNGHEH